MTWKKGSLITISLLFASFLLCQCGTDSGSASSTGPGGNGPLIDTLFADGFEQGLDLWARDLTWTLASGAYTGSYCMKAVDYTGIAGGAEITEDFDLRDYDSATLRFWNKMDYSGILVPGAGEARVLVEENDSYIAEAIWAEVFQVDSVWTEINISLDEYCGTAWKLEIAFWYYKFQPCEIQWWIDEVLLVAENE